MKALSGSGIRAESLRLEGMVRSGGETGLGGERMAKTFNVTAVCIPEEHYMVRLDDRLREIKSLIDAGKYFSNSGRW